jgi:hypothetical protein
MLGGELAINMRFFNSYFLIVLLSISKVLEILTCSFILFISKPKVMKKMVQNFRPVIFAPYMLGKT